MPGSLYSFADKIFQLESQAEENLRDFQQRKSGRLRIHASESLGLTTSFHHQPLQEEIPKIQIASIFSPISKLWRTRSDWRTIWGLSHLLEHKNWWSARFWRTGSF
jgi:hypothetical protein